MDELLFTKELEKSYFIRLVAQWGIFGQSSTKTPPCLFQQMHLFLGISQCIIHRSASVTYQFPYCKV